MSAITAELKALPVEFKRRGEELLVIFGLSPDLLNPPQLAPYYSSETGFHPADEGLSRQDTLQLPNLDYYLTERVIQHLEAYQTLGDELPIESDLFDEHLDDLVVRHKGVTVYHTYKYPGGPMSSYHYALYGGAERDDSETFDVRDFEVPNSIDRDDHVAVFRYAIDSGQLDEDGVVPEDEETEAETDEDE
jgi:hypothetical protein